VLHNDAFVGVGTSVREGLVGFRFAKCAAAGLGFGGVRKSGAHLADEILERGANVPIPLGRGFVEGDAPPDGITADQLWGNLTFCCQVELCAHDDDWYRLMEGEGGSGGSGGGGSEGEDGGGGDDEMQRSHVVQFTLTRSSPLKWYIRWRRSSISRRLVSWVRLCRCWSAKRDPRVV